MSQTAPQAGRRNSGRGDALCEVADASFDARGAGFWKTDGAQVVPLFGMYIRGSPAIAEVLAGETQETHRSAQFRTWEPVAKLFGTPRITPLESRQCI